MRTFHFPNFTIKQTPISVLQGRPQTGEINVSGKTMFTPLESPQPREQKPDLENHLQFPDLSF